MFSSEVLQGFLKKLYEGFDTSDAIEPTAWREVLRIMNEASLEGLLESGYPTHEETFLSRLKHSNEVFSAFKVHSMATQMQSRLYDGEGKLRSFKAWQEAVAPIAGHQVGSWLRTEYDTAVLRAHQAADWQEFERNRDILPNLRWMPTTSPTPDTLHEGFWSSGLTLPIDDPFWEEHHPANRWNCKCSLEATDEPIAGNVDEYEDKPTAQRGLEENPRHGHTFSDKHPYFPKDCKACPYYKAPKGTLNRLLGFLNKQDKDCYNCPHINQKLDEAKGITRHSLTDEQKAYRKELLNWAKENLLGKVVQREDIAQPIRFTTKGLKEALNQPHKHYLEKNEALRDIVERIQNGKYLGSKQDDKGRGIVFHYLTTDIAGETSIIVLKENITELQFYSITEKR